MKIFFTTFTIVFALIMGGYYLFINEIPTSLPDSAKSSVPENADLHLTAENHGSEDVADIPDTTAVTPASTPSKIVKRSLPTGSFELPKIKDATAVGFLEERHYFYTHESFLDAIATDDVEVVHLFLKAGMKIEFANRYSFEIPEDSKYFYYTEDGPVLYNPVSLAIVAGSDRVLPLLLTAGENLELLNKLTCAHQQDFQRKAYFDLFAFPLRAKNINLLRMLLKAGLKPESQAYLAVTLSGPTKKSIPKEYTPEERRRNFEVMADIMIELINNGQKVDQRFPVQALRPGPKPIEFILGTGNKEFREKFIARINDYESRKKLFEFIGRIKDFKPPQAEAY